LLRLGICTPGDWTGSAVDFVERGFKRFCKESGINTARRIWAGDLEILDHMFELNERQRHEVRAEMGDAAADLLFVVGVFTSAANIPVGPSLAVLEREHPLLPAAFYSGLRYCLWIWMYVYDHEDAAHHAEMGLVDMEESELADSIYPKVSASVPECLRKRLKMKPHRGFALISAIEPRLRGTLARQLITQLLDLSNEARGYRHAWPHRLIESVPGLNEYLEECDGVGPGCLLNWYEDDPINACFDEQMTYVGQNGPLEPTILRTVNVNSPERARDAEVRQVFDYVGAMVRSLASAAKLVETIRGIYDEHLRNNRLKSGLSVEPSPPGVRDE
jgi:hypothetical protein